MQLDMHCQLMTRDCQAPKKKKKMGELFFGKLVYSLFLEGTACMFVK